MSADNYRWLPQLCPICQTPPSKFVGRRGGAAHRQHLGVECLVWSCGGCGLVFPNPMPIPIHGLDQHYAVEPGDYFEHHDLNQKENSAAQLLAMGADICGSKGNLLDIGAGRGELLRVAKRQGWNATGIEPSMTFAEHASTHSGAEVKNCSIEDSSFPSDYFDVIIMAGVLEHLYEPDKAVAEISRILRPGGALFVDVPNERGLYFKVGNTYYKLKRRDWTVNLAPTFAPFHVFGFGPRSLRALLLKHRFEIRNWHVYGGSAYVPRLSSVLGRLEASAAKLVTLLSKLGNLGTYIETWAVRAE